MPDIELRGERVSYWMLKRSGEGCWNQVCIPIAHFPDKQGVYDTEFGVIGFSLSSVKNGNGDRSPTAILDCTKMRVLQSKRRKIRTINLTKEGVGSQQLSKGVNLVISTQANLEEFYD